MNRMDKWGLRIGMATVVVAIATIGATLWTFWIGQQTTIKHMEVNLFRDLAKDFFGEAGSANIFRDVRRAIERCEPLYKSWGGRFSNDDINRYLGFFEDLGFYKSRGVLSLETIDHGFGSYIIEAFEHPHIQRYAKELQSRARQYEAFAEFLLLAQEIERNPKRRDEITRTREGCSEPKMKESLQSEPPKGPRHLYRPKHYRIIPDEGG